MDSVSPQVRAALLPLVDDLRRGLRDVPAGDMSPKLRKVVATSGGRLTPPLLRSLFEELEASGWVREKLAEALDPEEGSDLHRYLVRPDGWWFAFADAAVAAVEPETVVDDGAARTIADLEGALEEAKRRQASLRQDNQALEDKLRVLRKEMKERSTDATAAGARRAAEARVRELEERLATVETERVELAGRVDDLRRRAADRSAERPREDSGPATAPSGGLSADPVVTARHLDLSIQALAAAARAGVPEPAAPAVAPPVDRDPPRLPPGLAPDSVDGLLAAMALETPDTVIVDGYNTTFHFDKEAWSTPPARKRLNEGLRRLRRVTKSPHRIVVVYDSTKAPSEPTVWNGQVEVRFTAAGTIADDAIVAMVAGGEAGAPVVITDDRELRERVVVHGALALWSTPLAEWIIGVT